MCLKMVAPEYSHKPWNRHKEFIYFLEQRNVSSVLFAYKDNWFGCLSRAAAVLVYNFDHLVEFLNQNPHINNRLACLVREARELPYLRVIMVVFACLGVHLVEPFYARSLEKGPEPLIPSSGISTRVSKLRDFYKGLQAQGFLQGSPHQPGQTNQRTVHQIHKTRISVEFQTSCSKVFKITTSQRC